MASKYFSNTETTNFARLSRLIVDVCCDVLRAVLKTKIPPPGLNAFLQSQRVHLSKYLEYHQLRFLFPPGGVFNGTLEDLDFSLIYKLIRNLQVIKISKSHKNGWVKSPDQTDRSLAANIERLRFQRNEAYGHISTASLSDRDFKDRWDVIRQVIVEIEQGTLVGDTFVTAVDNLLTVSMDPDTENYYIEKLRKQHQDFEAIVEDIKVAVSDVTDRQNTMTRDVDEMKGAVSDVTDRQNTMTRDVDEVKGAVSDVTDRQNTMTSDVDEVKGAVSDVTRDLDEVKEEMRDIKGRQKDKGNMKERDPKLAAMIETTRTKIQRERQSYHFIATKSLHDAHKKLLENRIVIIKGNTGDGKSSVAIELLRLQCCDEDGQQKRCMQPLELHDIKDLDSVAPKSGLVIYLDDIFGKNVVSEGDVVEWEKREESILSKLCESEHSEGNFLVITIRSEILNSLGSSCLEKTFTEQNIVDLNKYKDEEEKRELLRLYEPKHEFDKWTKVEEEEIIKSCPDIGFPQCCRLFRDTPTLQIERVNFFKRPFHFMKSSLAKLKDGKFYGLLYLFLNGGKVIENDLDPSSENIDKKLLEAAFAVNAVKTDPTNALDCKGRKAESVKESLENLLGWLVKKESIQKQGRSYPCYKFSHDSIEETVALLYGEKTPIGYIQNCPCKLLSYVTTTKNTSNRIVISSDDQIKAMYKRTVKELKSVDTEWYRYFSKRYRYSSECDYLVRLDVWTDFPFLQGFVRYLSGQNVDKSLCHKIKHDLLNQACSTGSDECALFLLSEGVKPDKTTPFCVVEGGSVRLLRELVKYDVIPTARADESRSHRYLTGDINVLHEACLFEREEMVIMLCDTYPHLVRQTDYGRESTLHFVARTGNCGIFQTVERTVLKSLCGDKVQRKCELVDGRVVHRSCVCGKYMSQLVDGLEWTVLHHSCMWGHRELSLELCKCYPALTTAVDKHGRTVLHYSCEEGHRELSLELCKFCPALTTTVDNDGWNCLHYIAMLTSDVDLFTECERHVKQYIETTGGKYDITTILTKYGKSVLDLAKRQTNLDKNPLYDHLVKLFSK